jgi:hypothetical protein
VGCLHHPNLGWRKSRRGPSPAAAHAGERGSRLQENCRERELHLVFPFFFLVRLLGPTT